MFFYAFKILISVVLIIAVTEISKRSSFVGGLVASIPLVSVLAMLWLYVDTRDATRVSELASSIFWLVLPSLVLFISLPVLLNQGIHFYLSLSIAIVLTMASYWLMLNALAYFGVKL